MYNIPDMPADEVTRRALAAYGWSDGMPLPTSVRRRNLGGLDYVVLYARDKVIAVYRVRNDGKLKRLKRLPGSL